MDENQVMPTPNGAGDASEPQNDTVDTGDMNTVCLGDASLQGAKDGDKVEFTATGTISEENGKRYVSIDQVDGDPVNQESDEPEADSGSIEDAAAKLKSTIAQQGGYNNAVDE